MVMQRKYFLRSIHGYTFQFLPGEPVSVPTRVVPEAANAGAVMVNPADAIGADQIEDGEAADKKPAINLSFEDRQAALKAALESVHEANDPDHFTAAGYPKLNIIRDTSGIADVRAKEISDAWDDMTSVDDA